MNTAPRLVRVFIIIAAVVIGSSIVTYWYGLTVLKSYSKITEVSETIRTLDDLLSTLKDAETGQRGYLLTGDENYLEPYDAASRQLSKQLRLLDSARLPEGSKQLVHLVNLLTHEKLAELSLTIESYRKGDRDAALTIVKTNTGKATMDKIRASIAQIQTSQAAYYREMVRSATRAARIRTTIFVLLGLINLLFLGWAYRFIARETHRRSEAEAEARKQEEMLRVTLASIGDCVIVTDVEGRITYMNTTAEALTGWSLAEARTRPAEQVFKIINETTREQVTSPVEKVLKYGQIVGLANHTLLIRKDGSEVPIDDSGAPIRKPNGDTLGVIVVFRDFSGHKKSERELKEAKDAANGASQAKDHFLAMLSHELRTPLTPVLATINVWGITGQVPPSMEPDVQMIRRNVELECRLIDDMLDLTRVSKGMLSMHPEVTNVHQLIALVIGMFEEQIRTSGLGISHKLNAANPYVHADSARLQQVMWNIVKNAAKFTGPGGNISIASNNNGSGNIRIVITDSGIGMSRETLARLFRPFDRGERDEMRHTGGLGLGMSISKALLDAMGGSISAASEGEGLGSSFTVTLPSVEPPQSKQPAGVVPEGEVTRDERLKVLLVEDHPDTANALKRLLELRGHELHWVHSVATAVETIAHHKFDLLLCDLGLPDGSGLDVIEYFRKFHQTPAIAVSGFGMESDIASALESGFNAHITKPINFQHLEATIRKLTNVEPTQLDGRANPNEDATGSTLQ